MGSVVPFPPRPAQWLVSAESAVQQFIRLLFPETQQALRTAARSLAPVRSAGQAPPLHNDETPGADTPGASGLPTSLARTPAMNTLPQASVTPLRANKPLAEVGSAQHTALMRWFSREPLHVVCEALADWPSFPLVPCSERPAHFAPARTWPRGGAA